MRLGLAHGFVRVIMIDKIIEFITTQFGVSLVLAAVVLGALQGAVAYSIYFERKIAAWIQDR